MAIYLLILFAITLLIQAIFATYAVCKKSDVVTDLSYGLTFIILTFVTYLLNDAFITLYSIIPATLVIIWGTRLATYLYRRIKKIKKDQRFDGIREEPLKFISFWILQAVSIFIILLPVIMISIDSSISKLSYISIIGFVVSLLGIVIEAVADKQKFDFKNNVKNSGKWVNVGLWKYSRHPNYLGEMMMWVGVFAFVQPFLSDWGYISVISPIYIIVLLLFVSGIPTLEKKYKELYRDNKDYMEYKKKTGLLFPKIF